jgi:hypothetical protein
VTEGPDDAVEDSVEVVLFQGEEGAEVELDEGLEEAEEVGPDFGEGVEVRSDEGQTRGEDHLQQFGQEVRADHNMQFFKHRRKERHKLLILGLRTALLEIVEKFSKGEDEGVQNVAGMLEVKVIAFFQHTGVDPDDCLLCMEHHLDRHEVEHVLALLRHQIINLH